MNLFLSLRFSIIWINCNSHITLSYLLGDMDVQFCTNRPTHFTLTELDNSESNSSNSSLLMTGFPVDSVQPFLFHLWIQLVMPATNQNMKLFMDSFLVGLQME